MYLHCLAQKFVSIFCISVYFNTPIYDSVPTESVSVFTKVRFGPFWSVSVPRESVSVLRESVSVSTKVRFGPFRSVLVRFGSQRVRFGPQRVRFGIHESPFRFPESPFRYSESPFRYPRKSVSVRSGPFRSVPVRFGKS